MKTQNGLDVQLIVENIKGVLPKDKEFIALHEPVFKGNDWEYVKECLDTGWVSSVGKYVDRFEEMLAEFTGVRYAVATVNGTAALHIAIKLVGVEQGDEVLVQTITFIATANAVMYCGAIPHFIDIEERTLGTDPFKLASYLDEIAEIRGGHCFNKVTGRRIKAVVPMHTFGHPVDLDPLVEVCEKFKIALVEDAAESLGSYYKRKHTGNWGKVATLSFNGNKVVTTGGGGAILTNDADIAKLAKHLTTTAKVPHAWEYAHDQVGYNYRLPNINAALGCAQLEQLPSVIERKRELAKRYQQAFQKIKSVSIMVESEFAKSNYWLNALILDREYEGERDHLLQALNNQGIMSRPLWNPMHSLPMYAQCPKMNLDVAESLNKRVINIPSGSQLGDIYV